MSVLEKLKALDAQRAQLLEGAKQEQERIGYLLKRPVLALVRLVLSRLIVHFGPFPICPPSRARF
jgi:hypothetical protein